MHRPKEKRPIYLIPPHIEKIRQKLVNGTKENRGETVELPTGQAVYGISRKTLKGETPDVEFSPVDNKQVIWGASPDIPEDSLKKTAQVAPDMTGSAGSQVSFFPPLWFSPLMSWVHFYMPRDIKTTYTWIRHWDTFHPLIGNAIDLHTQMPLSRFSLKVDDPYVRAVYESMMEMLGGLLLLYDMVREYWLLGEMFAYLYWDESVGMFTDVQILPPEDVIVQGSYFNQRIYLNPESLHIQPDSQIDRVILEKAPDLVSKVQKHEPIELDPFFVLQMQRKQSRYMLRGQSIVLRALKFLIYYDKLMEAQYAIAQRHITPKEVWTIGNDNYPATSQQIEELRQLVQRAGQSPLFTLFTNHTVKLEYYGANGKFINFQNEYEMIEKYVLTAMFTNKAITHGEGPCVSEDTLILTDVGFLDYKSAQQHIINGGKIAQFNPDTEEIEYVKPLGYKEQNYNGELVHLTSSVVDHLITPNHRIWYSPPHKDNWKKAEIRDVLQERKSFRMRVFGKWKGKRVDSFNIGGREIPAELFLKFIGIYIGDGYLQEIKFKNGQSVPIEIRITQQPTNRGFNAVKRVMDLLRDWGFTVIHREWLQRKDWVIVDTSLAKAVKDYSGKKHSTKFIHPDLKNLTPELLKSLIEGLLVTDAYYNEEKGFYEYSTTSERLAKDIVEIALKVGFNARFTIRRRKSRKPLYRIIISPNSRGKCPKIYSKQHVKYVPYKGIVYSFGVPSGLIVVMRNGKVIITGNTYSNASVAMRVLMQRYMYVRGLLESILLNNVFLPVAVANEFFEITQAELSHNIKRPFSERTPILPEFNWRAKANLLDSTNMASVARQLKDLGFSHKTICDVLGVDYEQDKYWREKEEGTVFDPLYEEWRKRMGQEVPIPVGNERTSTFKVPVKVGEYQVSRETTEPKIEEKEFTWISRGGLLSKMKQYKYYIEPHLKREGAVPAKIVANLKPPQRKGSPIIRELEPITEEEFKKLKLGLEGEK